MIVIQTLFQYFLGLRDSFTQNFEAWMVNNGQFLDQIYNKVPDNRTMHRFEN